MRVLIAYYSKTESTQKLAEVLKEKFEKKGHLVDMERIRTVKEHSFWGWFFIRIFKGECDIHLPKVQDVSQYSIVCIGSPNWSRLSLPMARYLNKVQGIKHKNVGLFSTTFLPPQLEWYIFSAYLLELTFSRIVDKRGARFIDSILLSSVFDRWSFTSNYGSRLIQRFCAKMETPIRSLKEYFLGQKEIQDIRFLVISFSIFLLLSFICQAVLSFFQIHIFSWGEFFYLSLVILIAYLMMLTMSALRFGIFLSKYLAGASLVIVLTMTIWFLAPHTFSFAICSFSKYLILGYLLILAAISFFRNPRAVLFTGLIAVLGYIFLSVVSPVPYLKKDWFSGLDIIFLLISVLMIAFITYNLQKYHFYLLETQDDIEKSRANLEVKVALRTQDLQELSEGLKEQVETRTQELRRKMEELEKFNRLSVGRELKMIELKGKIAKLEKNRKKELKH